MKNNGNIQCHFSLKDDFCCSSATYLCDRDNFKIIAVKTVFWCQRTCLQGTVIRSVDRMLKCPDQNDHNIIEVNHSAIRNYHGINEINIHIYFSIFYQFISENA